MILAQVEAMEAGTSCEHKVAQAAKESLEFCHDLLQTRAAAVLSPRPNDSVMLGPEQDYGLDFSLDFFFAEESFP
jgi:CelD/BcsL family acetyltransferase involved in cellulose biosynthesis